MYYIIMYINPSDLTIMTRYTLAMEKCSVAQGLYKIIVLYGLDYCIIMGTCHYAPISTLTVMSMFSCYNI